ncbi:glutamine--fructose-6-phosphate transaminase (isomerizing) [Gammaproteobacteria bacterium]|nr:glutamine--fructose-6-phosphate transaminase (isomerizing) [Gammaproteobacteria bacterium]
MCGIVAALRPGLPVLPTLIDGLRQLEYRGYDSAGVAWLDRDKIGRCRAVGRVADLVAKCGDPSAISADIGIAHTRWATHGGVTEPNAHPHLSRDEIALVHNGIIENHEALRDELISDGYRFESDTDTEVIVNLIHRRISVGDDLFEAVRNTVVQLRGAYSIAVMSQHEPQRIVGARDGSPLIAGIVDQGGYLASDMGALIRETQHYHVLENGDIVDIQPQGIAVYNVDGELQQRPVLTSSLSPAAIELGPYRHFMQKEIYEQPNAINETLEGRLGGDRVLDGILGPDSDALLDQVRGVQIIGCGTSYYTGLVARHWMESLGIPCDVEIATEFSARRHPDPSHRLVIAITQSGETIDLVKAVEHARAEGFPWVLTLCNVPESSLTRMADLLLLTRAGPEIGVASTKAFTAFLTALLLVTVLLARRRGLDGAAEAEIVHQLRELPATVQQAIDLGDATEQLAIQLARYDNAIFLGRGSHFPIALEGALKLKEISYIHAEGYPAGELKHGPLALIDENMPVIAVAPNDELTEKLRSNMQEVRARGGQLFVIADDSSTVRESDGVSVLRFPSSGSWISPMVAVIPLQLLAYHVAVIRGTDVDKPRNLAKSVTVE